MSSSTPQSSIFIVLLVSNLVFTSADNLDHSHPLIEKACSDPRLVSKTKLCVQILKTQPNIVSANNPLEISIAIIESGIMSATRARKYVVDSIESSKTGSNVALQECKSSFDSVIVSFDSALVEVKYDKEYMTATYDLLVGSTDGVQRCQDNIAARRIEDVVISNGIRDVTVYGLSAYQAVSGL